MKYIKKYEELEDKSKIQELDLSGKKLTELPDLSEYTNLKKLYCSDNKLTYLSKLPNTLECLDCTKNKLTSLPELPDTLKELYCYNNQLTSLPELPDTLKELYCYNNQLSFEDLEGYKEWYKNNKHIIDKEGLEYAYKVSNLTNKYNL